MTFQSMSTMGKRPWKTFHFLEANLFVLRYIKNSWEGLSPSKAGDGPTSPPITMHNGGSFQRDFLLRIGIRYNIFSSAIKAKAQLVLSDKLDFYRFVLKLTKLHPNEKWAIWNVLQEFKGCDGRFAPARHVKPPTVLTWEPGAAPGGRRSCGSLPLTRKVTIWGNSHLKI